MIEKPIKEWGYKWIPPDGPHGYIHILDREIVYIGVTCGREWGRSMDFSGRSCEHRLAFHASRTGEIRHYPVFEEDLYGWEDYTIEKAWGEGWPLLNQRKGAGKKREKALQFMQDHLPKTYARFREQHEGKGHRC